MITRTGTLQSKDATGSFFRDILVREANDGSIEYLVGDSARSRDGWASVPGDLVQQIRWDANG